MIAHGLGFQPQFFCYFLVGKRLCKQLGHALFSLAEYGPLSIGSPQLIQHIRWYELRTSCHHPQGMKQWFI